MGKKICGEINCSEGSVFIHYSHHIQKMLNFGLRIKNYA